MDSLRSGGMAEMTQSVENIEVEISAAISDTTIDGDGEVANSVDNIQVEISDEELPTPSITSRSLSSIGSIKSFLAKFKRSK